MKKILSCVAIAILAILFTSSTIMVTGCKTTTNGTNVVTTIDPVKLQQAKDALVPAVSSVLRRAILRSPDHANEIGTYARAVGSVFCRMAQNHVFDPAYLIIEMDKATRTIAIKSFT